MNEQAELTIVKDLDEVAELTTKRSRDFRLLLAGGLAYSRKTIRYRGDTDQFAVYNHIDSTGGLYTREQLATHTNIPEALEKGALVLEP